MPRVVALGCMDGHLLASTVIKHSEVLTGDILGVEHETQVAQSKSLTVQRFYCYKSNGWS